jgi:hypothetical protein
VVCGRFFLERWSVVLFVLSALSTVGNDGWCSRRMADRCRDDNTRHCGSNSRRLPKSHPHVSGSNVHGLSPNRRLSHTHAVGQALTQSHPCTLTRASSHVQRDPQSTDNTPTPTVRVTIATDGESLGLKFWVNETHVLGKSKQTDGDGACSAVQCLAPLAYSSGLCRASTAQPLS